MTLYFLGFNLCTGWSSTVNILLHFHYIPAFCLIPVFCSIGAKKLAIGAS